MRVNARCHHRVRQLHSSVPLCVCWSRGSDGRLKWPRWLTQGIVLISDIIRKELNADCSVLMGANVANDMGAWASVVLEHTLLPALPPCWVLIV